MSTLASLVPVGGWHPAHARLLPLPVGTLSAPLRSLLWVTGKWGKKRTGSDQVPNLFPLMLRHGRLFWPWLRFAARLMPYGTLDRRDTELMILRVGWNCRCRYEWGQHVRIALREGLTPTDIVRVTQGVDANDWLPHQAVMLRACDELHEDTLISTRTWDALEAYFSPAQMIEIALLIGHYNMLAGLLNSVGLPLEADAEAALCNAEAHCNVDAFQALK